jgi:LCP family protein required for cell wall assembly
LRQKLACYRASAAVRVVPALFGRRGVGDAQAEAALARIFDGPATYEGVYTRQGNPAWAGLERDGDSDNVIRTGDMFVPSGSQPGWVDMAKVAIPQADEQQRLSTGDTEGERTDTIMIAHIPDNDTSPTLLSIPRDSRVDVPGHGVNRINASFSLGGAPLLTQTVEQATGLRIDHYAEIGFGGFANIVDAIGGVEMNIEQDMNDTKTGLTIPAGGRRKVRFVISWSGWAGSVTVTGQASAASSRAAIRSAFDGSGSVSSAFP